MIESLIMYSHMELDVQPKGMSTYTALQTKKLRKDGSFSGVFKAYTEEMVLTWKEDLMLPANCTPVQDMLKAVYQSISAALTKPWLVNNPIDPAGSQSSTTTTLSLLQLPVLTPTIAPIPLKTGATANPSQPLSPSIPSNITINTAMVGNAPPKPPLPQSPMVNAMHPHDEIAQNLHAQAWNPMSLGPT
jgi:hypothetical protein